MSKTKTLTLGSLFDGSGGFPLAGILAGAKPLWASEIEPFAVRVTTARLPQMKHYGDVSQISGADLPPVDIITFGSPCFPAGTLVLTDKGYLPIEEVTVGMKVLTHMGRWREVTATGSKLGETVILKGNHYGLECTPNHPIYSADVQKYYPQLEDGKRGNIRLIGEEKKWTPAEEMQGKLWCVPLKTEYLPMEGPHYSGDKHQKPMPEMNEDFFYFVGRWLGDGWIRNTQRSGRPKGQRWGQIVLCDSSDKENELRAIVEKLTTRYHVEHCRTGVKVKFCSQVLCSWLKENFGEYAYGKKIPAWVYSIDREKQESLMKGFLDSDGYQSGENTWKITSVSKKLIEGMRILAEMLGYSTTVFRSNRPATHVIEGRTVNQRDTYVLGLAKSEKVEHLTDELHGWYLVRKVIPTHEVKTVYNMTVEEDNSYVADGIVVHNCQDMSIAGKRSGLDGSRSSLFYEAIRIVKEMREKTNGEKPRWICWENVPGAFSSNKGDDFKAVLEAVIGVKEPDAEVPAPEKEWSYADCYMGDGWSVAYRVLDAQYWGVPQRRQRIFLVADFAGERAPEVLFKSEGVSGYSAEGFRSWQRAANHSEDCLGTAGGADEGSGRDCGGGRGVTDALAVDGYNSSVSDKASTLGVNCGMSTGRNGIVLNDQGGERMDVTEEVTCTLRAEAHHPPVVLDEPQAFHINQRDEGIDLHGVSGALMATRNNQMQTFVVEQQEAVSAAGFCTEHSANARSIGYEEETSPTLRAGVVPAAIALENHPTDSRVKMCEDGTVQTLTSRMGTGGNNVPLVMEEELPAQTLKIRSGCDGGGKGAIRQVEKSATLGCNNDQTVFVPFVKGTRPHSAEEAPTWKEGEVANTLNTFDVGETRCNELAVKAYGICSKASHSMMSDNPHSGFYEAETSRTLDANGGNPNCNQGGIAIVAFTQNQRDEVRDLGDVSGALAAEPGMKQQTYVAQPTYSLQGNMIGRDDKNGPQGSGVNEDVSFTLDATDRHGVAYCMTTGDYTQVVAEKSPTLMARDYKDPPIITEQAYGFDPQKKSEGTGFSEEKSSTLVNGTNPGHHNGVVETVCFTPNCDVNGDTAGTITRKDTLNYHSQCVAEFENPKVAGTVAVGAHPSGFNGQDAYNDRLVCDPQEPFYIVRRLTPTECARLQGFPDFWCKGLEIENPTPEDIAFWSEVWETHRKIMGTSKKPKTEKQIIKWLKDPHSDSAEYRIWGNGVSLPVVFFVMAGIVWADDLDKNQ